MNNMVVFIFLVIIGIGGILYFSNQSSTKSQSLANLSGLVTPSPILNLSPAPSNPNNPQQLQQQEQQAQQPQQPQQQQQPVQPTTAPEPSLPVGPLVASQEAVIKTSKGDITLTLYTKDAPYTVTNFINKAKSGFYNGLTFHRVEDWVIQGGDPKGDGTGGGSMKTELNSKSFVTGSLGVARGGDINVSNDAQFFIVKSNATWLDNQYTNFGIVTSGMDVVNKIAIGDKILGITVQ